MTINLTDEERDYLREYVNSRLEENLDLEEAEMLGDLAEKLDASIPVAEFIKRVKTFLE